MASKSTASKSTPLSFFRSFSRKQKKIVNLAVIGGRGVGKSGEFVRTKIEKQQVFLPAFVVRFLTRRFIGDYSSSICSAYPHTVTLDNSPVAVIVWDTPALNTQVRLSGRYLLCLKYYTVMSGCWRDV